jgi:hypothetical protein
VTVNASDAEADAVVEQYSYEVLFVNSSGNYLVHTYPSSGYTNSDSTSFTTGAGKDLKRGGVYVVRVTVFDGADTTTRTSNNFTVAHCPPIITLLEPVVVVDGGDNATEAMGSYTDPEGDLPKLWEWTITGPGITGTVRTLGGRVPSCRTV